MGGAWGGAEMFFRRGLRKERLKPIGKRREIREVFGCVVCHL